MRVTRWIKRRFKAHPFLFLLVVFVVLLALFVGAAEVTSRPRFCLTCHYMKPFYESWAESEHHDVTCVKCHFAPGFGSKIRGKMQGLVQLMSYTTRAYRRHKLVANIPDASCLRPGCHENRLLTGPLVYRGVHFDHAHHLGDLKRGKKLRCVSCHSQIVQGDHMKVTEGTCFVCHFKLSDISPRPTDCSACHIDEDSPEALMNARFSHVELAHRRVPCDSCHGDVVVGQGNVPRENCYTCHWETKRLEKYDDVTLIHRTHIVENKIECLDCHVAIEHRSRHVTESTTLQCSSCHDATHLYVRNLFAGTGGADRTSAPSWTLHAGVDCQGCHVTQAAAEPGEPMEVMGPGTCGQCHEPGYGRILDEWTTAAAAKLARANAMLDEVKGTIDASPDPEKRAQALAAYDKARANLELAEKGRPVHNVAYADSLIRAAFEQMGEALAAVGSARQVAPNELAVLPSTPCTKCHYGIEEISRTVFDEPYDHRRHVLTAKMDCTACHSDKRVHGELIVGKTDCASCHHEGDTCDACHAVQRAVYQGTSDLISETAPSDMFTAEVICTDCHLDMRGQVIRSTAAGCLDCHEEGYDTMMGRWQADTDESLAQLAKRIEEVAALGPDPARDAAVSKARAIVEFVRQDKSRGVHNPYFISTMIYEGLDALSAAAGD